jgi:HPt (histidine-containing phosphotransfer) domain-containing protein
MDKNHKIIDFSHLYSIAGDDEIFKKELIGIFLKQIPVFIANMNQFLANNEIENFAREAHTAKSSVLIFGMVNTGQLLKNIQNLAEDKKMSEIAPILKLVEMEFNQAVTELLSTLEEG